VATDLPHLTLAFLQLLAGYPVPGRDDSVVPRDPSGRPQPLCARYSAAALARARELAESGRRSMGALLDAIPVVWLDGTAEGDVLRDVDTPDDLAAAERASGP
jgi:molybdopterin-guanine dinucleotide biosynthesis protein A